MSLSPLEIAFIVSLVFDFLTIISVIFLERKNQRSMVLWILGTIAFPYFAWFFYIIWGKGPRFSKKKWSSKKKLTDKMIEDKITKMKFEDNNGIEDASLEKIIKLNTRISENPCTIHNDTKVFISAEEMYNALKEDLRNAKSTIHIESYIYRPDLIGTEIRDILIEKAKEGVKVKLLYDDSGNIKTPNYFFKKLKAAGAEIYRFFPSKIRGFNLNFNYRNHRKIYVIDGSIGYVGGMNIGDEYRSMHKRIKPWRDTHLRIIGESVIFLQKRFLQDLYYCTTRNKNDVQEYQNKEEYFQIAKVKKVSPIQIISSGPDSEGEGIKYCYEKMISSANESIYIQTPYFIPDDSIINALILAQLSGVQVYLMVPGVYDYKIPYRVTCSYLKDLIDCGVKVYKYNGFIHSKTLICDEKVASIGTANMDIRSFALNFEVNAIIYDRNFAKQQVDIFKKDIDHSTEYTIEDYNNRNLWERFQERLFRIFASLM